MDSNPVNSWCNSSNHCPAELHTSCIKGFLMCSGCKALYAYVHKYKHKEWTRFPLRLPIGSKNCSFFAWVDLKKKLLRSKEKKRYKVETGDRMRETENAASGQLWLSMSLCACLWVCLQSACLSVCLCVWVEAWCGTSVKGNQSGSLMTERRKWEKTCWQKYLELQGITQ